MHYAASYIASFLLSPFNWIIVLLITAYFLRRPRTRKTLLLSALFIFIVFGNQFLLDLYARWWQQPAASATQGKTFSCGIVAGGFASPDASGEGYFNATADRFIEIEKLFKERVIQHILISGGNGKTEDKNFREAAWIKKQLAVVGIPDSSIFIEDNSNNTSENAFYTKHVLDSLHLRPPYILVTSAQHMRRASLLFSKAGVHVVPFPCSYIAGKGPFTWSSLLPQTSALLTWDIYLKESFAYLWYTLKK